jgi:hypothetical protein
MGKLPALILLCASLTVFANAQTTITLQQGTPIERTLGPAQVHTFTVDLQENSYVQLVVEQRGVDVVVKVASPSGKSLGDFDSPNGNDGPENVAFVALAAGSYRIMVQPLDSSAATEGHYEIKILELRKATEQELKTSQNVEVVKAKGLALLNDMEDTIAQIKSPPTRIRAELQAAELLWESDEKRASKYFSDAITGVKEFLATIDRTSPKCFEQYSVLSQLRAEIAQKLAVRDPEAALSFVYSTIPPLGQTGNRREQLSQESALELMVAEQIMRSDPVRALQMARQSLKKTLSPTLLNTLSQLQRQNTELAIEFGNEIASKLLSVKLIKDFDTMNLAINLVRWAQVLQKRSTTAAPNGAPAQKPILSDDNYRELLQKLFDDAVSYPTSPGPNYDNERDTAWRLLNALQEFGPDLDAVVNGGTAAVQKKFAELAGASGAQRYHVVQQYQAALDNGSAEPSEVIEKAPPDLRDQLYLELAQREANKGDTTRARQIIKEHISSPDEQRQALTSIEQQEVSRAINKGRVEEALKVIGAVRNPRERANQLAQIAAQIGPGQKRATAVSLLEQARSLLNTSPQAQDEDQMRALFEIARAFARYDVKRAFEIMDPLVDQVNDLCAAARILEGFGPEYYEDDELSLQNGSTVATLATQMSGVLGNLALINFDRAKSASDRIRLPEVRLRAYLEITQHTIQGK